MMDEETQQNIPRKTHGIPSGVNGRFGATEQNSRKTHEIFAIATEHIQLKGT